MAKCNCLKGEEFARLEILQQGRDTEKLGLAPNEPADVVKFVAPTENGPWLEKWRRAVPNVYAAMELMRKTAADDSGCDLSDVDVAVKFVKGAEEQ
jgi:hypothetical protein